jgi:D-lactate dehydrogenase
MANCTKISFFEMEEWHRNYLVEHAPPHWDLQVFTESLRPATAALARDAVVVSTFIYSEVNSDLIDQVTCLGLVATRSTGYDHIDVEACRKRSILTSNVPRYGENTVAEHAFGLILSLSRKIYQAYQRTTKLDFSLTGLRGFDLKGKTIGIVGAGAIGLHVIRIAKGFGMDVLAYDAHEQPLLAEVLGFRYTSLPELLSNSDVISLHVPLIPATHYLINEETIRLIKRGAILINTARGAIVETGAIVTALNEGILAGAGLDVLEGEESIKEEAQLLGQTLSVEKLRAIVQSYALLHRDNVIITPHLGFYSVEAEERILDTTIENIEGFLQGEPRNVVGA